MPAAPTRKYPRDPRQGRRNDIPEVAVTLTCSSKQTNYRLRTTNYRLQKLFLALRSVQFMKISYNWLRNYVDIPETPEEIGQVLTATGLEVEHIEPFETVKGGLKDLVIGHVVTCIKHPNADKLSMTTVDVGDGVLRKIVCG